MSLPRLQKVGEALTPAALQKPREKMKKRSGELWNGAEKVRHRLEIPTGFSVTSSRSRYQSTHQILKWGAVTSPGSRYREGAEACVVNEKQHFWTQTVWLRSPVDKGAGAVRRGCFRFRESKSKPSWRGYCAFSSKLSHSAFLCGRDTPTAVLRGHHQTLLVWTVTTWGQAARLQPQSFDSCVLSLE